MMRYFLLVLHVGTSIRLLCRKDKKACAQPAFGTIVRRQTDELKQITLTDYDTHFKQPQLPHLGASS